MMVAHSIQLRGFGSGLVVPETAFLAQSRRRLHLEPVPNEACGGKRPYHTIIPAFLTRAAPVGPFGVMAGTCSHRAMYK